jgi:hypothetical protein
VGNGFLNRFLLICTRRVRSLPEGDPVPPVLLQEYGGRLAKVMEIAAGLGRLERTLPARRLWAEHYAALTAGHPGLLGAVTSRGAPYVLRLAVIYAVLDQSPVITDAHLRSGWLQRATMKSGTARLPPRVPLLRSQMRSSV